MKHPPQHQPMPPREGFAKRLFASSAALILCAMTIPSQAQTTGTTNVPKKKIIYELQPIIAAPADGSMLPISLSTSILNIDEIEGQPTRGPKDKEISWTADRGGPVFLSQSKPSSQSSTSTQNDTPPNVGSAVELDFLQPFVKQSEPEDRKVQVTATYTPNQEEETSEDSTEGTDTDANSLPPTVHENPREEEVSLTYLDFWIAGSEESDDDVLIVRPTIAQSSDQGKKVIHWAKVVVKHSVPGELPLLLQSAGSKPLYFYGEQNDPNQLSEEPKLETVLEQPYANNQYFWVGTDAKGEGTATIQAQGNLGTGYKNAPEQKTLKLVPVEVVPDYNRDGKIDQADRGKISEKNPYRFWVNDDDDRLGEKRGKNSNDIPGSRSGSSNGEIDGIRDLIDFFPIHLDLQAALKTLPSTEYKYFLKHAEGALKFHEAEETRLDQDHDNQGPAAYLKNLAKALSLDGSTLKHANSSGVELSAGILGSFENGEGVLLCESTQQTQAPLILEIRKNDGKSIAEIKFPLKTSGVEDMYRHVNLRSAAGGTGGRATEIGEPSNYPDNIPGLLSDKYLVFVHGYNVNGEQARGWHSEVFKRMWWSGSIARFVGVSWHGDESQGGAGMTSPVAGLIPLIPGGPITPNYHANVINAFQTSDDLVSSLAWIDGEISIGAHSLGNMVVGLAIQDHGFQAENYFLLDAAVAMESYNAGETKQANMTNGDWVGYDERLWASEWHQLPWPQNDPRKKLTWRGRLGDVVNKINAYNFYSSEEEVLNNATDSQSSFLLGAIADDILIEAAFRGNVLGEQTWALQEILKGKGITGEVLGSIYGGWKFNFKFLSWPVGEPPPAEGTEIYAAIYETFSVPPLPFWKRYNTKLLQPDETTGLAGQPNQLMAKPFFDPLPAGKTHAELLAQAFPARTNPAGRNPVGVFDSPSKTGNINMATLKNGTYSADANEGRWRHSDIRDVGYLYTWKVYDKLKELGKLNQ